MPVSLDPGVELAAYRIIQEALTNSRRHAPGAAVDVELRYGDDGLRLRIRDNGPGPPGPAAPAAASAPVPAGGHGLLGMRERAAAVGGELTTGPAGGGGFAGLLGTQPDFTVAGTAADGAEAVRVCRALQPDVVLMDVRMPGTDGIEATRQLARPLPACSS